MAEGRLAPAEPSLQETYVSAPQTGADFFTAASSGGTEPTPIDELTGLPLPIYTRRYDYFQHDRNFHHHFHPGNSRQLQGYYDGKPVRYSRGQMIQEYLHKRYHQIFFGPPLPETRKDKFTVTVLALSGVLPRQALDLYTPGEFRVVDLSRGEHSFLSKSSRLHMEPDRRRGSKASRYENDKQRQRVGRFFADYVVEQALEEVITDEIIEKFLRTNNDKEKRILGRTMLENAVDVSVAELVVVHNEARRAGMVASGALAVKEVVEKYFSVGKFYQSLAEHTPGTLQTGVDAVELAM
ncbi:MAG TPA: hypothetical protein VHD84_00460 [Candidatus Saccharimonadales bacterium]|nr:hypothetical protein [Candidatus Saccharimonadales bacterium]